MFWKSSVPTIPFSISEDREDLTINGGKYETRMIRFVAVRYIYDSSGQIAITLHRTTSDQGEKVPLIYHPDTRAIVDLHSRLITALNPGVSESDARDVARAVEKDQTEYRLDDYSFVSPGKHIPFYDGEIVVVGNLLIERRMIAGYGVDEQQDGWDAAKLLIHQHGLKERAQVPFIQGTKRQVNRLFKAATRG